MTSLDDTSAATPKATLDRFQAEAVALRHTLDELGHIQREAWRKDAAAAREAIAGLQADLALATAEAEAERAKTREDLDRVLAALLDSWKALIDDLFVQGRLAEMDARDAVEKLRHDMERPVNELRTAVLHAIERLRAALTG